MTRRRTTRKDAECDMLLLLSPRGPNVLYTTIVVDVGPNLVDIVPSSDDIVADLLNTRTKLAVIGTHVVGPRPTLVWVTYIPSVYGFGPNVVQNCPITRARPNFGKLRQNIGDFGPTEEEVDLLPLICSDCGASAHGGTTQTPMRASVER